MNRLKELRKNKGLLQKDIAKHLNIAVSTYSYWESGRYDIDNENLKKLADFFNVSLDYLLCRTNLNYDNTNAINELPNTITMIDKNSGKLTMTVSEEEMQALITLIKAFNKSKKN